MKFLPDFITEELIYAIGWTVLHSFWQAAIVAIVFGLINLRLQRRSAGVRYFAGILSLGFILLMALFTFIDLYQPQAGIEAMGGGFLGSEAPVIHHMAEGSGALPFGIDYFVTYFNHHLPLIVSLWLLGAALFSVRLLGGLAYLEHLKFNHTYPVSQAWQHRLNVLRDRACLTIEIDLLESARVKTPMVIGHFKPVILLPFGALNGLNSDEVEAILAHELAHIARRDYLFNLFQSVVEVLFYFNPAVWWISAHIRKERENCCDDIAVELCGDSLTYARALVHMQELCQTTPHLAMSLARNRDQLLNRVYRLLNQAPEKQVVSGRLLASAALVITFCFFSMAPSSLSDEQGLHPLPKLEVFPVISALHPAKRLLLHQKPHLMSTDTLPNEPTSLEVVKGDGERMKVEINKGKITALEIDGTVIPATEYAQYEEKVEQYLGQSELPPLPPQPPMPPAVQLGELSPPPPPSPPAPPMPSVPGMRNKKINKIERKEVDGKTFLRIEMEGGTTFETAPGINLDFNDFIFEGLAPGDFDLHIAESFEADPDFWSEEYSAILEQIPNPEIYLDPWIEMSDSFQFEFNNRFQFDFSEIENLQEHMEHLQEHLNENLLQWEQIGRGDDFFFGEDGGSFQITGGSAYINGTIREQLEEALLRDKLIVDPNEYEFVLSKNKLMVNGKQQSVDTARKYWEFYEEISGMKLSDKTKFQIRRHNRED